MQKPLVRQTASPKLHRLRLGDVQKDTLEFIRMLMAPETRQAYVEAMIDRYRDENGGAWPSGRKLAAFMMEGRGTANDCLIDVRTLQRYIREHKDSSATTVAAGEQAQL